jgi:cobalt-zinc-cadmium efflux system outer membrane protein
MYMFMLEQEIPGRGKRERRAAAARAEVAVASAEVDARQLEIAGEVRRQYAALALARRDRLSAFTTGRALEELVEAAQATYGAGGGSQAAVLEAMLEVARIEERMAMLAGEERGTAVRLNALMNRDPGTPIGPLDSAAAASGDPGVEILARAAADRHPEVRAARAAIEQAGRTLDAARQERAPDWMVQGGYMLMPGEAGAWTARVGLTWPSAPWARARVTAAISESDKRRLAAEAALAAAETRVQQAVHEAAAKVDAATRRLAVVRTALVPQAQHLAEAAQVAFENAQGSLSEALDARLVLLAAELDEARLHAELELARADLDAASGDAWLAPWLPSPTSPPVPDGPGAVGSPAARLSRPVSTSREN